jgi:hypothetical protein
MGCRLHPLSNTIHSLDFAAIVTNSLCSYWSSKCRNSPRPYLLTYGAEPFLRTCQLCSTQELPSILWNPKIHYRVHRSPPLVPILSQIDPVHVIPSYLSEIYFNIVHRPTSWSSSGLFPSGFPTNILYSFRFSTFRATCPDNFIPTLEDLCDENILAATVARFITILPAVSV